MKQVPFPFVWVKLHTGIIRPAILVGYNSAHVFFDQYDREIQNAHGVQVGHSYSPAPQSFLIPNLWELRPGQKITMTDEHWNPGYFVRAENLVEADK